MASTPKNKTPKQARQDLEGFVKEFARVQDAIDARRAALHHLASVIERMRAAGKDVTEAEQTYRVLEAGLIPLDELAADALKKLEERARLQAEFEVGTISTVQAVIARCPGAAVSEAKIHAPTLFQNHLIERGMSLPMWVATKSKFKLKVNTAQSWVKPGKGGRRIPRTWADRIAAEFNDPRLSDSGNWPRGIRG